MFDDPPRTLDEYPIEDAELSVATSKMLQESGFKTMGDVRKLVRLRELAKPSNWREIDEVYRYLESIYKKPT